MPYAQNKIRAQYRSNKPSRTDQAAARDTDINRIVGQFLHTGQVPGPRQPPRIGDFSQVPDNLRDMIEQSRSVQRLINDLPPQLRTLPIERLLALTPDEVTTILKPPAAVGTTGT